MNILFPSEPFSPREVDSCFQSELESAKLVGFNTFLFDHDEFVRTGKLNHNLQLISTGPMEIVVLRGWMLKADQYKELWSELWQIGYKLINEPDQYVTCHHFNEYCGYIKPFTAKSSWFPVSDLGIKSLDKKRWGSLRAFLGSGDLLIKDYVKSAKGDEELFILKQELTNDEFHERVGRFIEARGKLFNGGIVLKQVEELKKYEGQTNEWRLFFLNNKLMVCSQNSDTPTQVTAPKEMIDICTKIAKGIPSNFFTIDIAEKEDEEWMVLEMGDGQVSGMPLMGDAIGFFNNMNNILNKIEA
jgi:hypothetical protein